jgi:L-alanine-DL-glutamate epimerase-like enolase superfamily enzyme
MRIDKVEIFHAAMPMKVPFKVAIGTTTISQSVFVRLTTDTGLVGIGEGNIFTPVVGETIETALAAAPLLAQVLLGADPCDIEGRVGDMQRRLPNNFTTRAAFDMALWDILGKAAGLPRVALLGGSRRAIASDNTVGIETPAVMAERAAGFKARGFSAIKVKLGTDLKTDLARMRAIRAAVGPEHELRIDANQGWSRTVAQAALAALVEFGPVLVEQPLVKSDIEGLARLRARSPIPLMADESLFDEFDAQRLVAAGACDYFNIKLAKSAGIFTALKINAIGEAAGIPCMVGCMTESGIGITATAHLASARRNIVFADLDSADMLGEDPVRGGFAYTAAGEVLPPTGPGLGVEIDPDWLARLSAIVVA